MDIRADGSDPQPATFAERGVAVPFTAPGLAGTRVRSGKDGLELVFANPSGARGTYVVPWAGVPDICHPTLHDLRLLAALQAGGGREVVTPAQVQAAARRVALQGAAGRAARAAAEAAEAADGTRLATTAAHLQTGLADAGLPPPDALEATLLARAVAELGIGPAAEDAPVPRALAALDGLRTGLLTWAASHPDDAAAAQLAAGLAMGAASAARTAMAAARHRNPALLLQAWRSGPGRVAALAARPAWLLDGWRLPGLLWAAASPGSSHALTDVIQLAPLPPREAQAWTGLQADPSAAGLLRRVLAARLDTQRIEGLRMSAPRAGAGRAGAQATKADGVPAPELVARNERLRAMAA